MTESLSKQIAMKKRHIADEEKSLEQLETRSAKAMASILKGYDIMGPKELKEQLNDWRDDRVVVQYLEQALGTIHVSCESADQMINAIDLLVTEHKEKHSLPLKAS